MSEICKFVHVSLFHYFCLYTGSPRSHYALFTSSLQRISFLSPLQRGAAGVCSTQQPRFGVQQICLWRVLLRRVRWRALEGCILLAQYSDVKTFRVSCFSVPSQASVREGYSKGLAPASPPPMATPPALALCTLQAPRLSLGEVCAKCSRTYVCPPCAVTQAALCLAAARLLAPFDLGEGKEGVSHEAAVAQVSATAQAAAAKWCGRGRGMRRGRTSAVEDASIAKTHLRNSRGLASPISSAPQTMARPSWGRWGWRRRPAAPVWTGAQSSTDHLTASAAMGMPMGIHCKTQIWKVRAGPSSKHPSSVPRAWYFKFRIRQSFDPDRWLPVFQIGDIMAAARLAEVGRSDQTAVVTD